MRLVVTPILPWKSMKLPLLPSSILLITPLTIPPTMSQTRTIKSKLVAKLTLLPTIHSLELTVITYRHNATPIMTSLYITHRVAMQNAAYVYQEVVQHNIRFQDVPLTVPTQRPGEAHALADMDIPNLCTKYHERLPRFQIHQSNKDLVEAKYRRTGSE